MAASDPLLFIDFEGRGIKEADGPHEVADQPILEIGAILVSADLTREYGRFESVIRPTAEALDDLRSIPFVYDMHVASGLYAELTAPDADQLPTLADAEDAILALLDELPAGQKVTIAGTGVTRYDKPQTQVQMPRLAARLNYDEQDISSARKRYEYIVGMPIVPAKPSKTHRAMADIEDDIRYQRAFDNLYAGSVSEGGTTDPVARQLLALALTEQYMQHDSFLNADGTEIATIQPPKVIQSLLEGVPYLDVIAGFMSMSQELLRLLAVNTGMDPEVALEGMRGALLDAGVRQG